MLTRDMLSRCAVGAELRRVPILKVIDRWHLKRTVASKTREGAAAVLLDAGMVRVASQGRGDAFDTLGLGNGQLVVDYPA
jgi:hypothetical protein